MVSMRRSHEARSRVPAPARIEPESTPRNAPAPHRRSCPPAVVPTPHRHSCGGRNPEGRRGRAVLSPSKGANGSPQPHGGPSQPSPPNPASIPAEAGIQGRGNPTAAHRSHPRPNPPPYRRRPVSRGGATPRRPISALPAQIRLHTGGGRYPGEGQPHGGPSQPSPPKSASIPAEAGIQGRGNPATYPLRRSRPLSPQAPAPAIVKP